MMRSLLSMGEPRRGHARACGLIALGVGIVLVRGVSAQRISTEYDHAVDFSAFKTFAIVSSTLRSPNPALNSELMKKRIDESFSRAFTGRGLTRVTVDAHVNISYTLGSPGRAASDGTLIVDVRDASTRSVVWRGVASDDERDAAKLAAKIDRTIAKLVERFPRK
jgi:hypothetical protein